MKFIYQAFTFYKLAIESKIQLKYNEELNNLLQHASSLNDFTYFICYWSTSPKFNIDDIIPKIISLFNSKYSNLNDKLNAWADFTIRFAPLKLEDQSKVVNILVEDYLQNSAEFSAKDYIYAMRYLQNGDIENKVNHRIIETLHDYLKLYQNDEIIEENVLSELEQVRQVMSYDIFEKIVKEFGIEIYVKIFNHIFDVQDRLNYKKELSVFDTASIIAQIQLSGRIINKSIMLQLIQKGDQESNDFLRSHLFIDINNTQDVFFMLDENMQPMGINLEKREWPTEMKVMSVEDISDYDKEIKDKWRKIFHDFNIIPQPKLYFHGY